MKSLLKKFEELSIAVTYAEAGEWEFAGRYSGKTPAFITSLKKAAAKMEKTLAAVTFAEANCHDISLSMLKDKHQKKPNSLLNFLNDIGLNNTPVSYGVAIV